MPDQILVVDDSLTIQKVIRIALARFTDSITTVGAHVEALVELSKSRPTMILADANLAGARSLAQLKRLSEAAPGVPMLLLVGSHEGINEASFRAEGMQWFIKKPFESHELVRKVEEILGRRLGEAMPDRVAAPAVALAEVPIRREAQPIPPPPVFSVNEVTQPEIIRFSLAEMNAPPEFSSTTSTKRVTGAWDMHEVTGTNTSPIEDASRRGKRAFSEDDFAPPSLRFAMTTIMPPSTPPPAPEAAAAAAASKQTATVQSMLEPMLREELSGLVRKVVEDYCAAHFPKLARELILSEIRRLAEEKARHLSEV